MNGYEKEQLALVVKKLHDGERRMTSLLRAVNIEVENSEHCRCLIYNMLNHDKIIETQQGE